ncbi:RING/U-box superfamily protein [Tripterygium wilfordii]|uniref:RING-type E3 ubiquitin transferase n=1 Tax=Tripterygium wilfordii TaxID=458696 RepID=A0A7J7E1H6_TRIWF|nr:RING-H2 finger protein ATL16-like [Tripterygium wilfordii]KAF5752381.1 RING/U-box superfamily protein [Tripterygium wilfordii]
MDHVSRSFMTHESLPISPITSPRNTIFGTHMHSSGASFPIIAIAIIGILATGFLLVSYYIFVIKCCLNWHRIDLLRRFSLSRNRGNEETSMVYSPAVETRGLDEAVIRSIPVFQYKKGEKNRDFCCECAVCLNEFQDNEKLRIIPNCKHVFHIDCIDVWLQNNANCPLCRTSIPSTIRFQLDQIIIPTSAPEEQSPCSGILIGGDEEFVVIELGNHIHTPSEAQERNTSSDLSGSSISPPSRKKEQRVLPTKLLHKKVTSMGDECIDIRNKDEQFAIQPIRRSFSMDSSADRLLFLSIQEIARESNQVSEVKSPVEGCSSRARTTCFSFSHGRGSRNAVLPVHLKP